MSWTPEQRWRYGPAISAAVRANAAVRLAITIDTIDPPARTGRPRLWSTLTILQALWWLCRAGAAWALLPAACPPRQTVGSRLGRWVRLAEREGLVHGALHPAAVIGLVALHAVTPSAISLGPMIAREYAQANAIEIFWAGRWAGSWYYSYWPAEASTLEVAGATVLLMMAFAVAATFMGVVTDPIQQALGLHEKRFHRFVGTLERLATRDPDAELTLPDPYIARLADVADWVTIGLRYLR